MTRWRRVLAALGYGDGGRGTTPRDADGGCAICGQQCTTGRMLAVDHDRSCCPDYLKTCGRCIRGLLCGACNQGIGKLQDSADLLRRAADYLTR